MHVTDLWGDISTVELAEPSVAQMLREQAKVLYDKTNGLLRAEVVTSGYNASLEYELVLQSPYIEDYRYVLLRVRHSLEADPPIHAVAGEREWTPIRDQSEFEAWLAETLRSPRTMSKIRILMDAARNQQA